MTRYAAGGRDADRDPERRGEGDLARDPNPSKPPHGVAPHVDQETRMQDYIEVTNHGAKFRVVRSNEHFSALEHHDFSTLDAAERFVESLIACDPTLQLVGHTVADPASLAAVSGLAADV
jgi:hypothetical protein